MSKIEQYVIFLLDKQIFGIEILKIKEVVSYREITPLPNIKGVVKGVIDLKGVILPVFDFRKKFNLPPTSYTHSHTIIIMEIWGRIMGVIVDEIFDIVELFPEEVQETSNLPPGIKAEYIKGIGNKEQELIILLDIDRLLSPEELEVLDST